MSGSLGIPNPDGLSGPANGSAHEAVTGSDLSPTSRDMPAADTRDPFSLSSFPELESRTGYREFRATYDRLLGLSDPQLQLPSESAARIDALERPPHLLLSGGPDRPALGVTLDPSNIEGVEILDGLERHGLQFYAPLVVRERSTLFDSPVSQFRINGEFGVPRAVSPTGIQLSAESSSLFEKLQNLKKDGRYSVSDFPANTPVVSAVALIPLSEDRIFSSEFELSFERSAAHPSYFVFSLVRDKFSARADLAEDNRVVVPISWRDAEERSLYSPARKFDPSLVAALRNFEGLHDPSALQHGHIVIAAAPFQRLHDRTAAGALGLGTSFSDDTRLLRPPSKSTAHPSLAAIRPGEVPPWRSRSAARAVGPLTDPKPIIYDIQIVAITPEFAANLSLQAIYEALSGRVND